MAIAQTPGLKVQGRFLYDHVGEKIVLIGVNKMIYWMDIDGIPSYPEIVAVLKKHEQYLMVNIGNEVGQSVSDSKYKTGYETAIKRMRAAGIHVPLVIDAAGYGQNLNGLQANGPYLISIDPDKNLLFFVHMWWPYMWGHSDQEVIDEIAQSVNMNLPLIVGEFGNKWDDTANGGIPYKTIITKCLKNEVGWLPWEWGPGNNPQTHLNMTNDSTYATLHDWGLEVAVTAGYSIKNNATKPYSLINLTPAPTPALGDVNSDGNITIVDALLIAQYSAGLIIHF